MKNSKYEIIITGSGAAGLYAAYNISKRSDIKGKILIITKAPFGESNSRYAQGGIAAAIGDRASVQLHIRDTLKSGAGLSDENTVKYITESAEEVINDLASIGAGFDRNTKGDFEYTSGGAHSTKRILHSGEDATGMVMIKALCDAINNAANIDIKERAMVTELLVTENECKGVIVFNNATKEHEIIYSPNIILATGGAGQIYKYTTNPYGATGDGIALAYKAGAEIQDIEFIQFHPTALTLSAENKNRYLITEAVRGEGAKLLNNNNEEFMSKYDKNRELAQRDIVSRAILSEMEKENKPNVFLDLSGINPDIIKKRFPTIAKKCLSSGIDITKDKIPVAPAAHYMTGGVKAEINGKTSVNGLYVIGELASTCFHGANRLASNSLLECVVCAKKLAQDIEFIDASIESDSIDAIIKKYETPSDVDTNNYSDLKNTLKEIMWNKAGIVRNEKSLTEAKNELETLINNTKNQVFSSQSGYEYRNMLITSYLITKCALERKESRGAHYRSDYPETLDVARHSVIKSA